MEALNQLVFQLKQMDQDEMVTALNKIRTTLHEISPFSSEPVDLVIWVKQEDVEANDYNPNSVAPPEMELLRTSINNDGYTQPIVSWEKEGMYEVVDGFHRTRCGREYEEIHNRIHGYFPLTVINDDRSDKADRMSATIRHNRARGKHRVDSMSDIVIELKRRNWSDAKIGKELGMDPDEVLRLTQITGLAEMFANESFSQAWEVESYEDDEIETIED